MSSHPDFNEMSNPDLINYMKCQSSEDKLFLVYINPDTKDRLTFPERMEVYGKYPKKQRESRSEINIEGYVYLATDGHYYKIGQSKAPKKRIASLMVGTPYEIKLLHTIPTDNMKWLENSLHNRFASKRTRGEWFSLTEEDVKYIKSL